jgi:hypothetical protein
LSAILRELNLSPEQLLADLPAFLTSLKTLMQSLSVDLTAYQADHIALRVNDWAVAEALHQAWLVYGEEWSNTHINGRPIVIIGLHQPIVFGDWLIEAIELPYPKADKITVAYKKDNVCLKLHPCTLKAVLDSENA